MTKAKKPKTKKVSKSNIKYNIFNQNRNLAIILMFVFVLPIIYFGGRYLGTLALKEPKLVADNIVIDIRKNNPLSAWQYVLSGQTTFTESALAGYFNNYTSHFQSKSIFVGGLKEGGKYPEAVFIYSFTNNGHTAYLKIILVQVSNNGSTQWKLSSFIGEDKKPNLDFNIND